MAFTPPPPERGVRPRSDGQPFDCRGQRAAVAEWLAHVEAGRIGRKVETPEDIRARVLANERVICGDGRLPIW